MALQLDNTTARENNPLIIRRAGTQEPGNPGTYYGNLPGVYFNEDYAGSAPNLTIPLMTFTGRNKAMILTMQGHVQSNNPSPGGGVALVTMRMDTQEIARVRCKLVNFDDFPFHMSAIFTPYEIATKVHNIDLRIISESNTQFKLINTLERTFRAQLAEI